MTLGCERKSDRQMVVRRRREKKRGGGFEETGSGCEEVKRQHNWSWVGLDSLFRLQSRSNSIETLNCVLNYYLWHACLWTDPSSNTSYNTEYTLALVGIEPVTVAVIMSPQATRWQTSPSFTSVKIRLTRYSPFQLLLLFLGRWLRFQSTSVRVPWSDVRTMWWIHLRKTVDLHGDSDCVPGTSG